MKVTSNTAAVSAADFRGMIDCQQIPGTCALDKLYRPERADMGSRLIVRARVLCNGEPYVFEAYTYSDIMDAWDVEDDDTRLDAKRKALHIVMQNNMIELRTAMSRRQKISLYY